MVRECGICDVKPLRHKMKMECEVCRIPYHASCVKVTKDIAQRYCLNQVDWCCAECLPAQSADYLLKRQLCEREDGKRKSLVRKDERNRKPVKQPKEPSQKTSSGQIPELQDKPNHLILDELLKDIPGPSSNRSEILNEVDDLISEDENINEITPEETPEIARLNTTLIYTVDSSTGDLLIETLEEKIEKLQADKIGQTTKLPPSRKKIKTGPFEQSVFVNLKEYCMVTKVWYNFSGKKFCDIKHTGDASDSAFKKKPLLYRHACEEAEFTSNGKLLSEQPEKISEFRHCHGFMFPIDLYLRTIDSRFIDISDCSEDHREAKCGDSELADLSNLLRCDESKRKGKRLTGSPKKRCIPDILPTIKGRDYFRTLSDYYHNINANPTQDERRKLAEQLKWCEKKVYAWFYNYRRTQTKHSQTGTQEALLNSGVSVHDKEEILTKHFTRVTIFPTDEDIKTLAAACQRTSCAIIRWFQKKRTEQGIVCEEPGSTQTQPSSEKNENRSRRFTNEQLKVLRQYFSNDPFPPNSVRNQLAQQLQVAEIRVRSWFRSERDRRDIKMNRSDQVIRQKRERITFTPAQKEMMENHFTKNPYPSTVEKQEIANRIGLNLERVSDWFAIRRTKLNKLGRAE